MADHPTILWFRRDLRLADNPALAAASRRGRPVVPVYVHDPEADQRWPAGAASRLWLHHALKALDQTLRRRRLHLVLRAGPTRAELDRLIDQTGADAVYFNRLYEPSRFESDVELEADLLARGLDVRTFNASLLFEPEGVLTRHGEPFQVFTPFWKACLRAGFPATGPEAMPLRAPRSWPAGLAPDDLKLRPRHAWADRLADPGAAGDLTAGGAGRRLKRFVAEALAGYESGRDFPGEDGTSRLSPYLHFGQVSPRQVLDEAFGRREGGADGAGRRAADAFARQLGWREFAAHLLYHFPRTAEAPLRVEYDRFPWRDDPEALEVWRRGRTGYPFVDAAMRQLWQTGWMHNRARMVAGSFLVKHLLLPWQVGAEWFWDTLLDADLANNTLGWQWVAGCGADAAPFFRIFNPVRQGERFDPAGRYVRRWAPELAALPAEWLHRPWEAPGSVLSAAGVVLGTDYPAPIVDHARARARALEAFARMRSARATVRG